MHTTTDSQPSVGWIGINPSLFAAAKATLDEEYTDPSAKPGNNVLCSGRIGTVDVAISCLPQPLQFGDVTSAAQNIITSPVAAKSFLVTGFCNGLISHDIKLGDLVISQPNARDEDVSEPMSTRKYSISQEAVRLQREVGADGRWLSSNCSTAVTSSPDSLQLTRTPVNCIGSYTHLHYGNLGQCSQNGPIKEFWNEMVATKNAPDFEAVAQEECAAGNAASYAKELIRGMSDGLTNNIASLRGTETVVPPYLGIKIPPFEPQQFPRHGEADLLVIPTANKAKGTLLREGFEKQKPKDAVIHLIIITVPVDSGVGEQPYNEAGVLGACTRISNALRYLNAPEYQETLLSKGIGTVILASIENYIQLDNVGRPTDYGVVVIHNATAGKTAAGLSWGVTVPPAYVGRARRFGFEGNPNHGRVTVGQILAAHVPDMDKADWHSVLAGRSRYDLLSDAISRLTIPW